MSYKQHIWRNRYRTPIPRGATIQKQRPGKKVVDCLLEIQEVVTDLKKVDQPTFRLRHRVSYPTRNTVIRLGRPGALYSDAITELQYYVDTLLDEPHKWVYRYGRPVPRGTIHQTRPGWSLAKAITELQDVIDTIGEGHTLLDIYNEHRQAIGQSAVGSATVADMRTWMEINCDNFVDHVSGPLNANEDDFLMFTLSTWRSAANIDADWSGFRSTEKGFNALKWSNPQKSFASSSLKSEDLEEKYVHVFNHVDPCPDVIDEFNTEWDGATWEYLGEGSVYSVEAGLAGAGYGVHVWGGRTRGYYKDIFLFFGLTRPVNCQIVWYGKLVGDDDADNVGLPYDKYEEFETSEPSKDAVILSPQIVWGGDSNPVTAYGIACGDVYNYMTYLRVIRLHKWDFTQA